MTRHRSTKRKVWTGLVLVLLGASTVVAAPVAAGEDAAGNLTCEAVIGDLGLTDVVMAKDDVQRTAPSEGTAENGDFVVTYEFGAAADGAPEAYVVTFSSEDLVYGAFVKQAAEKQGMSREAVFPDGALTGSIYVPDGEFSHVSFCTGTVPTTEPPATEPPEIPTTEPPTTEPPEIPTTEPPATEPPEIPTTEPPTTEPPEIPTTEPPETPTTDVGGEVVVPNPAPEPGPAPEAVPEAEGAPAVLGDTVVRSLPRTGSATVELGVVGVVMVLLGSALLALGGRDLRNQAAG